MKQKILTLSLAFALVFTMILPGISLANINEMYTDVKADHWAAKFIIKMNIQSVVNGYTDHTFKPNNGINQLEAIAMVVRFLGYQEEAESFRELDVGEENELYRYIQGVPNWAKGNVLVAARLGLISVASEAGFKPTEDASRAWMTKLLVTAIQKHGTLPTSTRGVSFTDEGSIPAWVKNEVNLASAANIITGYTDGSFKPDRTVTRAEMTALLYKSEEFIDPAYQKNRVKGHIEVKQDDALIVNVGKNELVKILINDGAILYQGNDRIDFAQLRTTDEIDAVVDSSKTILYLDLLDTSERKTNEVEGRVYLHDVAKQLLTIEDQNERLLSYKITADTVAAKNNNGIELKDVRQYDKVRLTIEENEIKFIEVLDAYQEQQQAEIISINSKEKVITAKYSDNTFEVITLKDNVKVLDQDGGSISIDVLKTGDNIMINFEQDKITSIQIPMSYKDAYVITKIQSKVMTLTKDGRSQDYTFDPEMKVVIKGYEDPSYSDLEVGDRIKAKLLQDVIIEVEVQNKERKLYILDSKDTNARALKVKDLKTNQLSYLSYESDVELYRDYETLDSVSKLFSNDRVVLTIQDGKVTRVDKAVYSYYEIRYIDTDAKLMWLKDQDSKERSFYYSDLTHINSTSNYISGFSVGDRVTVYSIGNEIVEIRK